MKKVFTVLVVLGLIVSIGFAIAQYFNENTYAVTVTDKQIKRYGESDKYLIFVKLDNGELKVFENTDSLVKLKFNSSDVFAQLEENKKYEFRVYGFRNRFLSMYENIIEVSEQ